MVDPLTAIDSSLSDPRRTSLAHDIRLQGIAMKGQQEGGWCDDAYVICCKRTDSDTAQVTDCLFTTYIKLISVCSSFKFLSHPL